MAISLLLPSLLVTVAPTPAWSWTVTSTAKLTLEAFLKRRETKPYREYDGGKVTRKAMPTLPHSIIQSLLGFVFWSFLQHHPIGIAGSELRCILWRGNR